MMESAPSLDDKQAPIFILGVMPRSGTNFLHRLICQHPDCGAINTTPVREDYLVHHAAWLSRYLGRLKWQWGHWGADAEFVKPLSHSVGKGLSTFLDTLSEAPRIVTKTPSVANLPYFFKFFPHAYLMIIVRDGRSVVASGMSGFGWHFETASRAWSRAARQIIEFRKSNKEFEDRFQVVHYEQLNENTAEQLDGVLRFMRLDVSRYDFDAALDTPVYGSSFSKSEGDQVTWKPQEKESGFKSNARWKSWSRFRHQRFNWIAAREMKALGYELEHGSGNALVHHLLDGVYQVVRLPRKFFGAVKAGLKGFIDAMKTPRGKVDLKK